LKIDSQIVLFTKKRDVMKKYIVNATELLADIVFPPVCACCGNHLMDHKHMICLECLNSRFEPAPADEIEILPEAVSFRLSLWDFDKYGYLQNLLHKLKYDHCTGIGEQIGHEAGQRLMVSGYIQAAAEWQLLAVPLHKKRYRTRGYNQSMEIARGVASSTGMPLLKDDAVKRVKHTKTQTGLNSGERASNISDAFEIAEPSHIRDKKLLLIDDVFTTGATTFELAHTIKPVSGYSCGILTIAKA